MRYIIPLILFIIISSCGNQKIRFVKTNTKQKVVQLADIPQLKKVDPSTKTPIAFEEEKKDENRIVNNTPSVIDEMPLQEQNSTFEAAEHSFPEITDDSTLISKEQANSIAQEALRAEKQGGLSLLFSILVFVFALISLIALVFLLGSSSGGSVIAFAALGIASIISWILGIYFGISSLSSYYNTPRGRKLAIAGLIISALPLVWIIFSLLL